jgi:hypothetical protein
MSKRIDRKQAVLNLRKEAEERVLKDEVMKFRLEAETLERLLLMAKKLNKPAGTLVREWVIEKLDSGENQREELPAIMAISMIANSLAKRGLLPKSQIGRIRQLLARAN